MAMQLPQSEKVTKADYVLVHEEDDEDEYLMKQVQEIHSEILKLVRRED